MVMGAGFWLVGGWSCYSAQRGVHGAVYTYLWADSWPTERRTMRPMTSNPVGSLGAITALMGGFGGDDGQGDPLVESGEIAARSSTPTIGW
jgi:hypothetical protein